MYTNSDSDKSDLAIEKIQPLDLRNNLVYKPDLAPDIENRILSKITTNLIGFQLLKIRFFRFFGLGARSEYKPETGEKPKFSLRKYILLGFIAIILFVIIDNFFKNETNFVELCKNPNSIPEAKKTVEVLLEKVGTKDCSEAEKELSKIPVLILNNNEIADISPLSGLTNLTGLVINNNNITDISPLLRLTNLSFLELGNNQITDISPLSGLTNLAGLVLE
ncbi:MAG: leucine-rich repeat domain-containing protein, partial [Symploca sp. SIO2E6]|nr:leucine-rich repeat domain-containing protein [Symploca sp. SIO2E6]